MVEVFEKSFRLVRECFSVLKKDKELLWFPILSGVVSIIIFVSFLIPLLLSGLIGTWVFYGTLFLFYILSYGVVIFFNAALIACAKIRLSGGDPKVRDGMKVAVQRFARIIEWAVVSATVGIILRALSDRSRGIGRIIIGVLGMVWSIVTYFVLPVMIFEDVGVGKAIKRSVELLRKTWGENLIGTISIGVFFFLLAIPGFLAIVGAFFILIFQEQLLLAGVIFAIAILYFLLLAVVNASLNSIFVTALYMYADSGKVPSAFSPELIKNAFDKKKA